MTLEDFQARYQYDQEKDKVGKGGFGAVYKAFDHQTGEVVAVKVSPVEDKAPNYSLLEEARKAVQFDHPNLVKYLEVFRISTQLGWYDFAVMEYIPYGHLAENKVPSGQLQPLLAGILWGLHYLHQNNIIHRDLKPQNILIDRVEGRLVPKITDFGLAKETTHNYTTNTTRFVTPEYMAPEQIDPRQRIGNQVDLWAIGVITYQICFGSLPFGARAEGHSEQEIIQRILTRKAPRYMRQMPRPYQGICKACLEFDPAKRAQSAEALLQMLDQAVWDVEEEPLLRQEPLPAGLAASLELELHTPPQVDIADPVAQHKTRPGAIMALQSPSDEIISAHLPTGVGRYVLGGLLLLLMLGIGGGSWLYQQSQQAKARQSMPFQRGASPTTATLHPQQLAGQELSGFKRDESRQLIPLKARILAASPQADMDIVRIKLGLHIGTSGRDQYVESQAIIRQDDLKILMAPITYNGQALYWAPGRLIMDQDGRMVWESVHADRHWLLKSKEGWDQ